MASFHAISAVLGCAIIFFAFGLYFSSGNVAIYLISYLRIRTQSNTIGHEHGLWFFVAVSISALLLPLGGMIRRVIGLRAVCSIAGFIQTLGILLTYFTLDLNFPLVVLTYGGSFLFSFGLAYTSTIVNCSMWFPHRKGLATGIVCSTMALAPLWTPLLTKFINPNNVKVSKDGFFHDEDVLNRTKDSVLLQAFISFALFAVGVLLLFPANHDQSFDGDEKDCSSSQIDDKEAITENEVQSIGLSPKEAIKTEDFYLLSFKLMITELIFYYLLFVYKPFGQTFISNDFYLSTIGALAAISNTSARLLMGYLKDIIKYKFCCIPLSAASTIIILIIPFTCNLHPFFYSSLMIAAIGLVGSQYAIMPSAITDTFGELYASENIGYVYYSTVLANLIGALGSQFLTKFLGWKGMIIIIGLISLIDFLINFLLPTDPTKKLEERVLKRNYLKNRLGSVLICPNCKYNNCTLNKCMLNC